jgi:3-deoxy-D-manno-octulosonate 8-phosphate phosphatase (KDO 8-P phosphatase)
MESNFKQRLSHINTFIFDVDGVLTDGSLILLPTGEQVRTMNIKDGYALQLAVKKGYKIAVISGKRSEPVADRLKGLGIFDLYMGINTKMEAYDEFISTYAISPEKILYMGDDIPDLDVMKKVGVAACPEDAAEEIKKIAIYISDKKGGKGCVRDVIRQVMKLHNKWIEE